MYLKIKYAAVLLLFALQHIQAQTVSKIEKLVPAGVSNIEEMVMPLPPSMLRIEYTGDITATKACSKDALDYGGLKVQLSWYNKNDETGKMMLGMVSNKADIEKHWKTNKEELDKIYERYKTGNYGTSFTYTEVLEETVPGGKLHMISSSNSCPESDNVRNQLVNARCFFFNGTAHGEITIEAHCSPDEIRNMVKAIIKNAGEFNFAGLL